jgi:hypothetical protein
MLFYLKSFSIFFSSHDLFLSRNYFVSGLRSTIRKILTSIAIVILFFPYVCWFIHLLIKLRWLKELRIGTRLPKYVVWLLDLCFSGCFRTLHNLSYRFVSGYKRSCWRFRKIRSRLFDFGLRFHFCRFLWGINLEVFWLR